MADTPNGFYHAVFIDTAVKYKNALTSFAFNDFDSSTYFDQLTKLRPVTNNTTADIKDVPQKWIALHKWKDNYYLYYPSDFGYHYRFAITDSTTIDYTMEGPEPSRLNKILFLSLTTLVIDRTNYWEGKKVQIEIINTAKGIAVFTFSATKYNKEGYQLLMVDVTKTHLFPTIVNYCRTDKQPEFDFDKTDFKTLTK